MDHHGRERGARAATFGRRKVAPRMCVADRKPHIRAFLAEALEELGFVTCQCMQARELAAVVAVHLPDIVMLGLSAGEAEAGEMLRTLASADYGGKVLVLGSRESPLAATVQALGTSLGIAMLPTLATPFGADQLRESVAAFLPSAAPPSVPFDAVEALAAGWLELWYQPKIHARTLSLCDAEALVRLRHPTWGVVAPACFMPDPEDPNFRAVSEFVIDRAIEDWHNFASHHVPVGLAINLPIAFLRCEDSLRRLWLQMLPARKFARTMLGRPVALPG
jgi:CheY-like chemotaxis protein